MNRRRFITNVALLVLGSTVAIPALAQKPDPWLTIKGKKGPGVGKNIVFISGDEEYRSEEGLPQLARILAERHGFNCTVLFAVDPKDGAVCANVNDNIPGLEHLKNADLVVMLIRWRNLPDDQMKYIVDYAESGRPMIGLRTSTHPFNLKNSAFQKYTWDNKSADYEGGFGRQVFGETWVAHHGNHGKEGTRGILADSASSPILRGIKPGDIHVTTDVYAVRLPLPGDCAPVVFGQILESLDPNSKPADGARNNPMMPVAWTKTYKGAAGKSARVFTTTMGAAVDLQTEGVRRLLVNAAFWATGMEKRITPQLNVDLVGDYQPSKFEFRALEAWKPGKRPDQY